MSRSGNRVKIGESGNPTKRAASINAGTSHPSRLLAVIEKDDKNARLDEEYDWHNKLRHKRTHGEWFELSFLDVMGFVRAASRPPWGRK